MGMTVPCFHALGNVPLSIALLTILNNSLGNNCEMSLRIRLEILLIPDDFYIINFKHYVRSKTVCRQLHKA